MPDPYANYPPELHPANYEMKRNRQKPSEPHSEAKPLIPDMTNDELRKLAREKLSMALQAVDPLEQPEMTRKLCAELMDRLDGKPMQQQVLDMTMKASVVSLHATDREILQQFLLDKPSFIEG